MKSKSKQKSGAITLLIAFLAIALMLNVALTFAYFTDNKDVGTQTPLQFLPRNMQSISSRSGMQQAVRLKSLRRLLLESSTKFA